MILGLMVEDAQIVVKYVIPKEPKRESLFSDWGDMPFDMPGFMLISRYEPNIDKLTL